MKKKFDLKSFLLMNLGVLILATGLYYFLVPSDLAAGGVTGFAMLINHLFPNIPIGIIMIISNGVLFIIAFLVIGKEFGGYTVYNSLMLSGIIYIFEIITPMDGPLVDDLLINLIYGILIQGVGMAIIFNQNSSTGGTDIIAKIISNFTNFNIGSSLFVVDSLIVLGAAIVFGLELGLYALLGILINSAVIDKVIAGFNTKVKIAIISDKEDEVSRFIKEEMKRGVTLFFGVGGFSNSEKRIINTVVPRREYLVIKNRVKEIDPKAFIWVSFVNEVLGEGFTD
ncbi:MAG TPA: YitT family protein [Tissierellaceae bacterium]|nr:YitT family protein [Tissierellaceae bacterium]